MPVTEATYRRVALEDPERHWELHHGDLRPKPGTTMEHNATQSGLLLLFHRQLEPSKYHCRSNNSRVQGHDRSFFVPDLFVVPAEFTRARRGQGETLETYSEPLPLVVEVWSRSTGEYDVMAKLPEYQRRGDLEIWLVHPYENTITAWRRQAGGSYTETLHSSGVIEPAHLPGVRIDLADLFAFD